MTIRCTTLRVVPAWEARLGESRNSESCNSESRNGLDPDIPCDLFKRHPPRVAQVQSSNVLFHRHVKDSGSTAGVVPRVATVWSSSLIQGPTK